MTLNFRTNFSALHRFITTCLPKFRIVFIIHQLFNPWLVHQYLIAAFLPVYLTLWKGNWKKTDLMYQAPEASSTGRSVSPCDIPGMNPLKHCTQKWLIKTFLYPVIRSTISFQTLWINLRLKGFMNGQYIFIGKIKCSDFYTCPFSYHFPIITY